MVESKEQNTKKVFLLTFHGSVNYGAVLQAYALYKTINDAGIDCEVIDYNRIRHHRNFLQIERNSNIKSIVVQLLRLPGRFALHKKFNRFTTKRMKLTTKNYNGFGSLSGEGFPSEAKYIVGSDQIWNCKLTDNNFHYYLDFVDSDNKFAYAASFGVSNTDDWEHSDRCVSLLKQFKKISVREEEGSKIIEKWLGERVEVVCDPTFLVNSSSWREILQKPLKICGGGYILLFMLSKDDVLIASAKKYAHKRNVQLVNIVYTAPKIDGVTNISELSPEQWLGYIDNADCIFTNSFHGFALAISLNKQVWVSLSRIGRNSRIVNLANRLCIANRILTEKSDLQDTIDYGKVNQCISRERESGLEFLKGIL